MVFLLLFLFTKMLAGPYIIKTSPFHSESKIMTYTVFTLKTGCPVQDAPEPECFALAPIYIVTAKWGKKLLTFLFFFSFFLRDKKMQLKLGIESALSCVFEQT